MPKKHFSILMNLFDVGAVTVQDIMVPRARIESIKLDDEIETIAHQLATSYHQRLPDGSFRDTVVFSIIAPEWPAVKKNLIWRLDRPR